MGFHAKLLLFLGYLLVYAAAANHGRFATEPWAGLLADAYAPEGSQVEPPAGARGPIGGGA